MHRTANVNEYSTRYSEAIDSCVKTDPKQWRLQSAGNKQGSGAYLENWPEKFVPVEDYTVGACPEDPIPAIIDTTDGSVVCRGKPSPGEYLSELEQKLHNTARAAYEMRLKLGIAREQARKDLPLSNYTEAYWKCDLRNIFNFLSLRMDSHAQLEIREFANVMHQIVSEICPLAVGAFDEYDMRRGGLLLTATEVSILKEFVRTMCVRDAMTDTTIVNIMDKETGWTEKNRERGEAIEKFKRLSLTS